MKSQLTTPAYTSATATSQTQGLLPSPASGRVVTPSMEGCCFGGRDELLDPCPMRPYLLLLCPAWPSQSWGCCPEDLSSLGVGTAKCDDKRCLTLQEHLGASPRLETWWQVHQGKRSTWSGSAGEHWVWLQSHGGRRNPKRLASSRLPRDPPAKNNVAPSFSQCLLAESKCQRCHAPVFILATAWGLASRHWDMVRWIRCPAAAPAVPC